MKRIQSRLATLLLVLSFFVLIPTTVYAWIAYVEQKGFVTLESGDIEIDVRADEGYFSPTLLLDDLTFIDFEEDLIDDETETFNAIASPLKVTIEVDEESLSLKNRLSFEGIDPGLLYLIIFEGVDLDEDDELITDYQSYIETITDDALTIPEKRQALLDHNQTVLDQVEALVLDAEEELTIQLVFWGDYDALEVSQDGIDTAYDIALLIETIQARGDFD
ncbi:MAG: hypothetical protein ACLFTZ_03875 [Acholeplasmataceae bacterium]